MAPRRGTRGTRVRRARLLVGFAVCAAVLSGCGESDPLTPPGRFAEDVDLSGQTFTVTGKEFAEQIVLCKMTIALLQSAHATVVDACDTVGSGTVRGALVGGRANKLAAVVTEKANAAVDKARASA